MTSSKPNRHLTYWQCGRVNNSLLFIYPIITIILQHSLSQEHSLQGGETFFDEQPSSHQSRYCHDWKRRACYWLGTHCTHIFHSSESNPHTLKEWETQWQPHLWQWLTFCKLIHLLPEKTCKSKSTWVLNTSSGSEYGTSCTSFPPASSQLRDKPPPKEWSLCVLPIVVYNLGILSRHLAENWICSYVHKN